MNKKSIQVNDKIRYWQELWFDLIENFSKNLFSIEFLSPHLTIIDIIDEIQLIQFKNKDNKAYFYKQLKNFLVKDPAISNQFKSDFILLKKDYYKGSNKYILNLCEKILYKFKRGDYFIESFRTLKKILQNSSWEDDDEEKIRNISQNIIIEFLIKGYSLKTILSFVKNVFDSYSIIDGKYLTTNFPHNIDQKKFCLKGKFDIESFNKNIQEKIDSLSISGRLDGIQNYFKKKSKDCFYIFFIEGLKGDIDITFGDVNFYSPKIKNYIKKWRFEFLKDREILKIDESNYFLNCAVKMKYLDVEKSKAEALEKIEKALSIINLYLPIKNSIKILSERYFMVDLDGTQIEAGISQQNRKIFKWFGSYELNPQECSDRFGDRLLNSKSDFFFTSLDKNTEIEKKIVNSLSLYRKGKESNRYEDKLINYWIVIENIMNFKSTDRLKSFENALKYLPYLRTFDLAPRLAKELYEFVEVKSMFEENISDNVLRKCNLDPNQNSKIDLEPFIKNLNLLENQVNSKFLKEKIKFVIKFFNDNDFAKIVIQREIEKIENDILLIYRLRNQIVHNANLNFHVLPYYVQKIEDLAKDLLKEIIYKYKVLKIDNLEDILIEYVIALNQLISKLEQKEIKSFLKLKL